MNSDFKSHVVSRLTLDRRKQHIDIPNRYQAQFISRSSGRPHNSSIRIIQDVHKMAELATRLDTHPPHAFLSARPIQNFDELRRDLESSMLRLRADPQYRHARAWIMLIDFQEDDSYIIEPFRRQLLDMFKYEYNWEIARYSIGGALRISTIEQEVADAICNFSSESIVPGGFVCFYISGRVLRTQQGGCTICGHNSMILNAESSGLSWDSLMESIRQTFGEGNRRLVILDSCTPATAYLEPRGFEMISASYWETAGGVPPPCMFLQAVVEAVRSNGFLTAIQLVSLLYHTDAVRSGKAMPVYKNNSWFFRQSSAMIHGMQPGAIMERAQGGAHSFTRPLVFVLVKVHVGAIHSCREFVVKMPLELWLGLVDKPGYMFTRCCLRHPSVAPLLTSNLGLLSRRLQFRLSTTCRLASGCRFEGPNAVDDFERTTASERLPSTLIIMLRLLLAAYLLGFSFRDRRVDAANSIDGQPPNKLAAACPNYATYASVPHPPLSTGKLALPFQRPDPQCRTFSSQEIERVIKEVTSKMKDPDLARLFENAFPSTTDTTVKFHTTGKDNGLVRTDGFHYARDEGAWEGPQSFITTGDIVAEWLRDSTNQLRPYLSLAKKDPAIFDLVLGAINTQSEYVIESPYCNAFQPPPISKLPVSSNGQDDTVHPVYEPSAVFECKYELDSLAHFLALANDFYHHTASTKFANQRWLLAIETVLDVLTKQSRPTFDPETGAYVRNDYTFQRTTNVGTETLGLQGVGNPLNGGTGLVRSAFRPSDDVTILGFFIPANAMISVELGRTSKILQAVGKASLAKTVQKWSEQIRAGVLEHGVVKHKKYGKVFAYEVDGYGSSILMDDANLPSLLALPIMGFCDAKDIVYQNTRKMILDRHGNPYFLSGKEFQGIGGLRNAWPMSVLMQAQTSDNDDEIKQCLDLVLKSSRLGLVHESVDVDHVRQYTRSWFAWANGVFAVTILDLAKRKPHLIFGPGAAPYVMMSLIYARNRCDDLPWYTGRVTWHEASTTVQPEEASDSDTLPRPPSTDRAYDVSSTATDQSAPRLALALRPAGESAISRLPARTGGPGLYGPDRGYQPLREALASWLGRQFGVEPEAERICITGGASQSLACILQSFTDPTLTRAVWIVEPCYHLACGIFEDAGFGARLRAAPGDGEGVDVDGLERRMTEMDNEVMPQLKVRQPLPALSLALCVDGNKPLKVPGPTRKSYKHVIYCVATCSNPSGITMSLRRRESLIRLARAHDALIISDDVYDFLTWPLQGDARPGAPSLPRLCDIDLASSDSLFGNAVSNGSFSKMVGPGMRTGWVEGSTAFVRGLGDTASTLSGGAPSQFCAAVLADLVMNGQLEMHIEDQLRPSLQRRHRIITDAVREHLSPLGITTRDDEDWYGGYFVWLSATTTTPLPPPRLIAEAAMRDANLVIGPGTMFEVRGDDRRTRFEAEIRLCFALGLLLKRMREDKKYYDDLRATFSKGANLDEYK
ncbi:hypothetical protein L249_4937 [Ophiocordyceps polyrhachis-furcata BCC 54312]|uniref:Aminotransferase class I/classII large domain-containing protein n=1 Tax=Ophiocordyceps polyrhachis-furcata BCC 54312 TaxID=1330021 RepID=A0A367L3N2_9HYPO|nr:hypothetical protein L249_4937 [Ophiocordyceps polyrhachis-furcata BCC 54312]